MAELFKTIDEVKKSVAISGAFEIETLAPYISSAADKYLKQWISPAFYNELVTSFEDENLSAANEKALPYVRKCLINFALYKYAPMGQIQFSDSGIHISVSESKKTAFEHQFKALQSSFIETGYDSLETLLQFLEANEDDYATWKGSDQYTKNKKHFINSSKVFEEHYELKRGRQTFKAITPTMGHIEKLAIKPIIGPAYFLDLKTKIQSKAALSTPDQLILDEIQPAVAFFTIAEAIANNTVKVIEEGITTNSGSAQISTEVLSKKISQAKTMANRYISSLTKQLNDNLDDYPLYKTYVAEDEEPTTSVNENLKGIFSV